MSTERIPRLRLLELAIAVAGAGSNAETVLGLSQKFDDYVNGAVPTGAAKSEANKPAAAKPAAKAAPAEAGQAIETTTPPAKTGPTTEEVKAAVIALVNKGNELAGNDKTGREYAAAVLQPFGAKNVTTIKPEDYAKVLEALKAKFDSIVAEAELTG